MIELERITREAARLQAEGTAFLLATVVRVSGSSYRRPGARMLVADNRWLSGCVSGGCLEGDVMLRGTHRCRDGAVVVTYDSTTDDGEAWGVGLGCNGIVEVLLEHVAPSARHEGLAFARACFSGECAGALVTVIQSTDTRAPVGACLAISADNEIVTSLSHPAVRRELEHAARGAPGVVELAELGIAVLVERIAPSPQLFVLGSGHDAEPIVGLAQSIGMRVTVADRSIRERIRFVGADRVLATGGARAELVAAIDAAADPYVIVMHHQREADRDALAVALASRARYIGVLGPARRTHELLAELGVKPGEDHRVHAPIGLDVGAETPEQIAVAIVAELQAVQRRRPGGMLRHRPRAIHANLAIAVLAAGGSRRLGRPKQLVEIEGAPLVCRVATTCASAAAGPVAVVLGAHASKIADSLAGVPVTLITNDDWNEGIASSIRTAVRWAETTAADALAIVLGDQPLLDIAHVSALRNEWLAGAERVASRFDGIIGAPAVFDRARWGDLMQLEGDQTMADLPAGSPLAPIARAAAWKAASELVCTTAGKFLTVPTSLTAARTSDAGLAAGCQIVMGSAKDQLEMRVAIAADSRSVKQLAMHVFGDDAEDVGAELLPELTNMFMGALKGAFSAESIAFAAGLPEGLTPARVMHPANPYTLEQCFELQVVDARVLVHLGLRSVANATVAIAGLREGMVLAKDVFNAKGLMLVSAGTRLSFNMIERLRGMLAPKQPVEVLGS